MQVSKNLQALSLANVEAEIGSRGNRNRSQCQTQTYQRPVTTYFYPAYSLRRLLNRLSHPLVINLWVAEAISGPMRRATTRCPQHRSPACQSKRRSKPPFSKCPSRARRASRSRYCRRSRSKKLPCPAAVPRALQPVFRLEDPTVAR